MALKNPWNYKFNYIIEFIHYCLLYGNLVLTFNLDYCFIVPKCNFKQVNSRESEQSLFIIVLGISPILILKQDRQKQGCLKHGK